MPHPTSEDEFCDLMRDLLARGRAADVDAVIELAAARFEHWHANYRIMVDNHIDCTRRCMWWLGVKAAAHALALGRHRRYERKRERAVRVR